jgi:hypothetical protein
VVLGRVFRFNVTEVDMPGTQWVGGKWQLGLTPANRRRVLHLLLEEYKEVNADWRLRDKYVEDKFMQSVFVFTLISALLAAVATAFAHFNGLRDMLPLAFPIGFVLFGVLFFFAVVMLISLVKDTYYRDGSERMSRLLLNALQVELDCDCISVFRKEAEDPKDPYPVPEKSGPFVRKIKAPSDGKAKLGMPHWMERSFSRRRTFKWITAYYTLVTFLCLAVSLACLVCWIAKVGYQPRAL